MHQQSHSIVRLDVHLPNRQSVYFHEAAGQEALAQQLEQNKNSTLMAWFQLNQHDEAAHNFYFYDISLYYVFENNMWQRCRQNSSKIIGRMYTVHPRDQDKYYLWLLLLHVKGATSFENLRTVNGVLHDDFKSAAIA